MEMAEKSKETAGSEFNLYFLELLAVGRDRCFINAGFGLLLTPGPQGLERK